MSYFLVFLAEHDGSMCCVQCRGMPVALLISRDKPGTAMEYQNLKKKREKILRADWIEVPKLPLICVLFSLFSFSLPSLKALPCTSMLTSLSEVHENIGSGNDEKVQMEIF